MALNIADIFFYEELTRIVDHETGARWILSRSSKNYHHVENSMYKSSVRDFVAPSSTSSPSGPSSPLTKASVMDGVASAEHHSIKNTSSSDSCRASLPFSLSSTDLFSLPRTESASLVFAFKAALPNVGTPRSQKSDPSMLGLLFTDAAHHVLDRASPAQDFNVKK
jgi:hypothetical protein